MRLISNECIRVSMIKIKTFKDEKKGRRKRKKMKAQSKARVWAVYRQKFKWARKDFKSQSKLKRKQGTFLIYQTGKQVKAW